MRWFLLAAVLVAGVAAEWQWNNVLDKMKSVAKHVGLMHSEPDEWQMEHHGGPHRRPWFCHGLDCPRFKTVRKGRGYDVRCYERQTWVKTDNDEIDQKDFKSMFKRLFAYIRGANEDKRKIRMTAPVVVSMWYNISNHKTWSNMRFWSSSRRRGPWSEQSEACEACTDENAGSIECPHHCGPPKPTDPKVKISRTPQVCLYVRSFDGWVMSRSYSYYKQLWYLSQDLKRDNRNYVKGLSFLGLYDSPMRLFGRHNEVMRLVSCGRRDCTAEVAEDPDMPLPPEMEAPMVEQSQYEEKMVEDAYE